MCWRLGLEAIKTQGGGEADPEHCVVSDLVIVLEGREAGLIYGDGLDGAQCVDVLRLMLMQTRMGWERLRSLRMSGPLFEL
ncbi:MAG: hypothetical protein ABWU16_08785 [Halothiobacillaceae bacterium]